MLYPVFRHKRSCHSATSPGGYLLLKCIIRSGKKTTLIESFALVRIHVHRKTVVVGAGYIAVELAGILNALGSQTRLVIRRHQALRTFDSAIAANNLVEMENAGMVVDKFSKVSIRHLVSCLWPIG